jgi:uncharacterized protein (TIGR03067 family)
MRAIYRRPTAVFAIVACFIASTASAQPDAVDNELTRFNGHWRVIEMVENGNAIPEDQMRQWLPGGGVLEIVDYTILFKSPIDGKKTTKSFRLDPTSYPKRIVITERDKTTGTGIYEFNQGKLVVCVAHADAQLPNDFSAPTGSDRTLIVLQRFETGRSEIPAVTARAAARKPIYEQPPELAQSKLAPPPPPQPVAAAPNPSPPPIVVDTAAGAILTDTQVRSMTAGTWRINDTEGSIDLVFYPSGTFQTYRYYRMLRNFQYVFVPTPISSGNWSIVNGRLIANVTSSTRLDRINQTFVPAVRSISATDMILVDHLGRVSRAVKLR